MLRIGKLFAAIMVVALIAGTAMMSFRRGWFRWKMPKPGKIILINGTTSSGKTTVIKRIQEQSELAWMAVGLDTFLGAMSEKYYSGGPKQSEGFVHETTVYEGKKLTRAIWGSHAKQILEGMPATVEMLARRGLNLILDEVLMEDERFQDYLKHLNGLDVFFVAIKPPLETSEAWEKARGERPLGMTRYQFDKVHKSKTYDFEVDPSSQDPDDVAKQILDAWKGRSGSKTF